MTPCETYQSQLLDYLYDLLEPAELAEVRQHLEQCTACQAALARAQAQQKVLARAAKTKFPAVRFQAPPQVVPSPGPVEVLPLRQRGVNWGAWAVAASILLLLGGVGVLGGSFVVQQARQEAVVVEARREYGQLFANVQEARLQHDTKLVSLERDVKTTQELLGTAGASAARKLQELYNRQVRLRVVGPETIQAGAPNNFEIQTRNVTNQPVTAQLNVRVADQNQRILYEEKNVQCQGAYRVALPRDLALRPQTQLFLEVDAQREGGPADQVREKLTLAPPVFVTHLTTDRPMYRPGETVYFRSLTLERVSLKPVDEELQLVYVVKKPSGEETVILQGASRLRAAPSSNGTPLTGPDGKPIQGIGCGAYPIPPDALGGEYTLLVREARNRFPPQERKILVNQYRLPRLNKELEFTRKSYGPGDDVLAACKVSRVEGGAPVADRPVTATVNVDGQRYGADGKPSPNPIRLKTDARGAVNVRVKLPAAIERGDASLSVEFNDGGSVEPIVRTIPIVLKKLLVEFFPVGGNLIAGVPNEVYFQARTTLGKPADVRGQIVDDRGQVVEANVVTVNVPDQPALNQGIGSFRDFVPEAGRTYELKIDSPTGIEGRYLLPAVQADGVALRVRMPVVEPDQPIEVVVQSAGQDRTLRIGAYCRGRLMDQQTVVAKKGEAASLPLRPAQDIAGVYRVTVFEEAGMEGNRPQLLPRAERLIYRKSTARLNLAVQPDRKQYVPGEKVTCAIDCTDEKNQPAPAILLVAAVDKSLLTLVDEKTHRGMPTHFLLTSEVKRAEDLEYADFLLGPHPLAWAGLDRLLGTQGWRRFAEQDPAKFRQEQREEADRMLLAWGQGQSQQVDLVQKEFQRVQTELAAERTKLEQQLNQAQVQLAAMRNDPQFSQELQRLDAAAAGARRQQILAERELETTRAHFRAAAALGLGGGIAIVFCVSLLVGLVRGVRRGVPYYGLAAACSLILVAGLALWQWDEASLVRTPLRLVAQADTARANAEGLLELELRPAAPPRPMARETPEAALKDQPGPAGAPVAAKTRGVIADRFRAEKKDVAGTPRPQALMLKRAEAGKEAMPADALGLQRQQVRLEEERIAPMEMGGGRPAGALRLAPLQKQAQGRRMVRGGLEAARPPEPVIVRQYAHVHPQGASPELRSDFPDTVYWHPVLVLPSGKGQIAFELGDSVTTYQLTAYGHTLDGRLGAVTAAVEARLPFTVEPALPIEVTASDKLDIPVSLANNTTQPRDVSVRVAPTGLAILQGPDDKPLTLPAEGRGRQIFRCQPTLVEGEGRLVFEGQSPPFTDSVVRTVKIVPDGFPVIESRSDVLEGVARHEIDLPKEWLPRTLHCQVNVYPSTLASLQQGLEALLREPNGCFEQTSTSNYPNLLVLDYLRESDQVRPEVERRARELLARGYQKLTSFECQTPAQPARREGYEWFGGTAPPHEALTAYGLLQFRDMSRVQEVDPVMLQRTRAYLLSRRDGKGGFQRNTRAIDTFGRAPDDITNAYIIWALTEGGKDDDVERELAALREQAKDSKDPYFLALVANSLLNRAKNDEALALLKKLAGEQKPDGHLDGARTSITHSGGRDLQVETTALTVLAWLKANRPEFAVNVQNAVKWIGQQRGGHGAFGSTQATILALKALIAFTRANKKTAEAGELFLFVGDQRVAQLAFPAGAQEVLNLSVPLPEQHLKPGKNNLRVELTGKNVLPYTLAWSYRTLTPLSADKSPVRLTRRLDRDTANEGETVRLNVTVENVSGQGQGMTVAIIGLPAGLTIPEDMKQLKDHARPRNDGAEPGLISFWETRGRELILYWRDFAPGKKVEVPLDLICRVPGEYRGPASRAYLYYNADQKHWVEPLQIVIRAKAP